MSRILIALKNRKCQKNINQFLDQYKLTKNSQIKLLHVIENVEAAANWPSEIYKQDVDVMLNEYSNELSERFANIDVKTAVLEGSPKDEILKAAYDWQPEMILLGTHDKSGVGTFLPDSVSTFVPSHAPCTTVVVRKVLKGFR